MNILGKWPFFVTVLSLINIFEKKGTSFGEKPFISSTKTTPFAQVGPLNSPPFEESTKSAFLYTVGLLGAVPESKLQNQNFLGDFQPRTNCLEI